MCATAASKLSDIDLNACRNRGETLAACRARIEAQHAAADSPEMADMMRFILEAEALREKLAGIISTHESGCRCPVCRVLKRGGDDGQHGYLMRSMHAALWNVDTMLGVAEGVLPVSPRAWRIRERAKARAAG